MALNKITFSLRTVIPSTFLNAIQRGNQEQIALQRYPVPLPAIRYSDGTVPVATAAAGKPGIKMGGFGVGTGYFQGENAKGTTKTEYLAFDVALPDSYDDGEDIQIGLTCRVNQTGGTISVKSVDMECYKAADAGTVGADLCQTAAQNMTTSMAEYLFTILQTGLMRGDRLRVILKTVVTETANTGTQYTEVGGASMYADIRG